MVEARPAKKGAKKGKAPAMKGKKGGAFVLDGVSEAELQAMYEHEMAIMMS